MCNHGARAHSHALPSCCDFTCTSYRYMHQLPLALPCMASTASALLQSSALAHMPAPACARAPMPPGLLGRRAAKQVAGQHIGTPPGHPLSHIGQHSQHMALSGVAPDHSCSRLHGQARVWSAEPRGGQLGKLLMEHMRACMLPQDRARAPWVAAARAVATRAYISGCCPLSKRGQTGQCHQTGP